MGSRPLIFLEILPALMHVPPFSQRYIHAYIALSHASPASHGGSRAHWRGGASALLESDAAARACGFSRQRIVVASGSGLPQELSSTFPADTARQFWRVFPSVMLPIYMAVGDQTVVASALPAIAGALGDVERVSWVIIGYLISSTIAAPVYGYIGDVFGRRLLLFVALAIFMIGAICCAFAPTMDTLIAARVLQGFGGGGLMSMSQALLAEVIPPRERGRYQGYNATVFVAASAVGPVMGALLTAQFGWHSIFYINIPVGIIAFALIFRIQNRSLARQPGWSFDYPGLIYFVGFIVPLLLALEQIRRFDTQGSVTMVALATGAILSMLLLIRHSRRAAHPILPVGLMKQTAIWNAQAQIVCHGAMMTALIAFIPLFLRVTGVGDLQDVGFTLLLFSFFIALSSISVGWAVTRTGRTMVYPAIGMGFTALIFVWFALYAAGLTIKGIYVAMAVLAIAMGPVMTVAQVTIQSVAGRKLLGAASGSVQLARTVGAVFGTAVFGTILFATLAIKDPEAAPMFGRILNMGPEALAAMSAPRRAEIMAEIVTGFRYGFLLLAGIAALSCILAATNPSRRI
jgi:MFS family permease